MSLCLSNRLHSVYIKILFHCLTCDGNKTDSNLQHNFLLFVSIDKITGVGGEMLWIYIGSRREKQFNSEQMLIMLFGVLYNNVIMPGI